VFLHFFTFFITVIW